MTNLDSPGKAAPAAAGAVRADAGHPPPAPRWTRTIRAREISHETLPDLMPPGRVNFVLDLPCPACGCDVLVVYTAAGQPAVIDCIDCRNGYLPGGGHRDDVKKPARRAAKGGAA